MKNFKTTLVKVTMLLAILFVAGVGVNTEAKAKPKLSSKKITINVGQKKKLKVKNVKKKKKVKWSTKNKAIATVNKKGKVVGKKKGKTTVIAKVGKKSLKCKVTVKKKDSSKKSSDKKTDDKNTSKKISESVKQELPSAKQYRVFNGPERMAIGKTEDLFVYLYWAGSPIKIPSNDAKVSGYKWISTNPEVISIDKYGIATPKKEGTTKISVKYLDRSGEWRETNSYKVEVVNAGDVSFSFSYGLNREWVDMTSSYLANKLNQSGAFNYVKVMVTNNSDTAITMEKRSGLYVTKWWSFYTQDKKDVIVPANSTVTVLYRFDGGVWLLSETQQIQLYYNYGGDRIEALYNVKNNLWQY